MIGANSILGLITLILLELVLGIDNLVFITILAGKLSPTLARKASIIGLSFALITRLCLLFIIGTAATLTHPLFSVFSIDITIRKVILFFGGVFLLAKATTELHEKIEGPGGLPLGTQGKVISLLSSGIDSPVATYLMMKRGCEVVALHFDGAPFTQPKAVENVEKIIEKLQEYASGVPIKTRIIKYGDYLQKCKDDAPEKLTCVLCKSGMYKLAEKLAEDMGALAIVDGSSVGQVASQTLSNILATRYGVEMPILSPLIGLDKIEIERIADEIGTFEISKIDDGGCSAVPR